MVLFILHLQTLLPKDGRLYVAPTVLLVNTLKLFHVCLVQWGRFRTSLGQQTLQLAWNARSALTPILAPAYAVCVPLVYTQILLNLRIVMRA